MVAHHIASDAWSLQPLLRDLDTAYEARCAGREPSWPALPVQYVDFGRWQRDHLGTEDDPESEIAGQVAYWRTALAELPDELPLPTDRPRPARSSYRGGAVEVTVPAALHRALRGLAHDCGASMFMVAQAAVATLLTRLGAGTDLPFGTPVAGRNDQALDDLVGFFVNTLVLRTDTAGDPTFRELVGRVRETNLAAYAHQDLPFERLVEILNPARSLARHPLFQVMVSYEHLLGGDDQLLGMAAEDVDVAVSESKFDLSFDLTETADGTGITLDLEYSADLFDRTTVEAMAQRFLLVLAAVADAPDRRIGAVEVLTGAERTRLLTDWGSKALAVTPSTLPAVFDAQADRHPGRDRAERRRHPAHLRRAARQGEPARAHADRPRRRAGDAGRRRAAPGRADDRDRARGAQGRRRVPAARPGPADRAARRALRRLPTRRCWSPRRRSRRLPSWACRPCSPPTRAHPTTIRPTWTGWRRCTRPTRPT